MRKGRGRNSSSYDKHQQTRQPFRDGNSDVFLCVPLRSCNMWQGSSVSAVMLLLREPNRRNESSSSGRPV